MADRLPCDADLAFATAQTLARKMTDLARDSEGLPERYAGQVVEVTREVDEWLDVLGTLVVDVILADGQGGSVPALAGAGALRRLRDGWRAACLVGDRAAQDHAGDFHAQAIAHLRLLRLTVGLPEWEDPQVEAKDSEVEAPPLTAPAPRERVLEVGWALDGVLMLNGKRVDAYKPSGTSRQTVLTETSAIARSIVSLDGKSFVEERFSEATVKKANSLLWTKKTGVKMVPVDELPGRVRPELRSDANAEVLRVEAYERTEEFI